MIGLHGEYKLVVTRPGGVVSTDWTSNTVLTQGLNRLGVGSPNVAAHCQIGTGLTLPDAAQTALDVRLTSAAVAGPAVLLNVGAPTYTANHTFQYNFTAGSVVGDISEIGVGWASTGSLFSRTLLTNSLGVVTPVTVSAEDQLTVYYRISVTPELNDTTNDFTLGSTTYTCTNRLCGVSGFAASELFNTNMLGYVTSVTAYEASVEPCDITAPNPQAVGASITGTVSPVAYIAESFYTTTPINMGYTVGNLTGGIGILLVTFSGGVKQQIIFNPPLQKTDSKSITLQIRLPWSRVT